MRHASLQVPIVVRFALLFHPSQVRAGEKLLRAEEHRVIAGVFPASSGLCRSCQSLFWGWFPVRVSFCCWLLWWWCLWHLSLVLLLAALVACRAAR